jgi:hypothetical protein
MPLTKEQKNSGLLITFCGLGAWLWWKNRPPSKDDEEELRNEDRLREMISGNQAYLRHDPNEIDRLGARLERAGRDLDQESLNRGIAHELDLTKNPYVARKQAIERLRENPDYYRYVEDGEIFGGEGGDVQHHHAPEASSESDLEPEPTPEAA